MKQTHLHKMKLFKYLWSGGFLGIIGLLFVIPGVVIIFNKLLLGGAILILLGLILFFSARTHLYWLKFGISFFIVDFLLSVIPILFILYPNDSLLIVNPFLGVAVTNIKNDNIVGFLYHYQTVGTYTWPVVWFIAGAFLGLIYGKIKNRNTIQPR